MTKQSARARAHTNFALVKYWGKRGTTLNLPAVGSISVTLQGLATETSVTFDPALDDDLLDLNGTAANVEDRQRVSRFLDLVRSKAKVDAHAHVVSRYDFPTGAGLASSASGFAALALAATTAAGLELEPTQLSELARRGSGSAARSIFGGFVELARGHRDDGSDCVARELAPASHWPLKVMVAVVSENKKDTGSTSGMDASRATSPFYPAWVDTHPHDMASLRTAVADKDFALLAKITERSCMKMHAVMLATDPALVYWRGASIEVVHAVRELQRSGIAATYTIDAGPQVKVLTLAEHARAVEDTLKKVPGVLRVIASELGPAAHIIER
jgi:diphosphomevalonate decarboxylase